MQLTAVPYDDAQILLDAMTAELAARYGGRGASPADGREFLAPYGVFLVVEVDGEHVACGGLRLLQDGIGEVKRMYVAPDHRGKGHARTVLGGLLDHARAVGLTEAWLETGSLQPEAMALYESEGFTSIPPYGYFKDQPLSRCYRRPL